MSNNIDSIISKLLERDDVGAVMRNPLNPDELTILKIFHHTNGEKSLPDAKDEILATANDIYAVSVNGKDNENERISDMIDKFNAENKK